MRPPAPILGIPIDPVTMDEAVDEIERLVRLGRERDTAHQVVTVNVDFVVNAIRDADVMGILQGADLAIADGMPLVVAGNRSGVPIPERVTGADLVPALAARSAATGLRIHLFGSRAGVAEQARDLLLARSPGAVITADSGPMIPDPDAPGADVVAALDEIDADVLCVALGNPKQERFIRAVRGQLRTPVMIGVGGTLDLLVGVHQRAPMWMQRTGLEWIFRALQEPRRLGRRYLNDIVVFGPRFARFLWRTRTLVAPGATASVPAADPTTGTVRLDGIERLSPASIGSLIAQRRTARQDGTAFAITGAGPELVTQLRRLDVAFLLEPT